MSQTTAFYSGKYNRITGLCAPRNGQIQIIIRDHFAGNEHLIVMEMDELMGMAREDQDHLFSKVLNTHGIVHEYDTFAQRFQVQIGFR